MKCHNKMAYLLSENRMPLRSNKKSRQEHLTEDMKVDSISFVT